MSKKTYVDVESIKGALNRTAEHYDEFDPYAANIYRQAIKIIHYHPVANVQEVREGRWLRGLCTVCGESNPTLRKNEVTGYLECRFLPYCPYCGAKML